MTAQDQSASLQSHAIKRRILSFLGDFGFLPVILVVLYIAFGLAEPAFFSMTNTVNILKQSSFLIILACAQMFVLLTRGFDLSLGATISMVSVVAALVMVAIAPQGEGPAVLALAAGILAGVAAAAVLGLINGYCVAYLDISPFLVTLGVQGIAVGLAATLSNGSPIFDTPGILVDWLGRGEWFGFIPAPVGICLVVLAGSYVILNHTVLGRSIYILGANPRAADIAGQPRRRYTLIAYVICSSIAAIGAIMMMARSGTGEPSLGSGVMLQSIAAAVIGGVALRGGEGRVIHVIFGGLLVTVLSIGMNLVRVDGFLQQIVLGCVVVGAVFLDRLRLLIRV